MSKFTPGPWEHYEETISAGPDHKLIFQTVRDGAGKNIARLNDLKTAHLIAAAPEMYESLMGLGDQVAELIEQMQMDEWTDSKGHPIALNVGMLGLVKEMNSMMKVLKKARGEGE